MEGSLPTLETFLTKPSSLPHRVACAAAAESRYAQPFGAIPIRFGHPARLNNRAGFRRIKFIASPVSDTRAALIVEELHQIGR